MLWYSIGLPIVAVTAAMWLGPHDAVAGSYTVRQCNPSLAISASSFAWRVFGSPAVVQHPNSGCGEFGLAARTSVGMSQTYSSGGYGGYYVEAPADTAFVRFAGSFGTFATCCVTGMDPYAEVREHADGSGARSSIFQGSLGNGSWQSPSGTSGPVSLAWSGSAAGFSARRISYGLACSNAAPCQQSTSGEIRVRGRSFEFGVDDLVGPQLGELSGSLLENGWIRGTRSLEVSASDEGGGLTELTASFDGGLPRVSASNCSKTAGVYIALRPCPLARTAEWGVDTTDLGDGLHTVEFAATDAGGTVADESRSLRVDNNAPSVSTIVSAEGEEWRRVNDFNIQWSDTEEVAPVAWVHYEICSTEPPVSCLSDSRAPTGSELRHVVVPETGSYKLRLWREDAAGNVDVGAKSSSVTLRFDDEAPAVPQLEPTLGWLGAAQADYYEMPVRPADGLAPPVSGIAGYSLSTDGSSPDATIDVPASSRMYPIENVPEGSTVIKARTVSGAGVSSLASASAVVRVDRTPPTASLGHEPLTNGWHTQPLVFRVEAVDQATLSGMEAAPSSAPATQGGHVVVQVDEHEPTVQRGAEAKVAFAEDGRHTLSYHAVDAAGNPSDKKSGAFKIDRTPPMGVFESTDAADPQRLVVSASDATSGVDGGWIEYRRDGAGGFTRLATSVDGDRMSARVDDSALSPGRYEFRAVVKDVAGNEAIVGRRADGSAMELGLPVREGTRVEIAADRKPKACAQRKPRRATQKGRKPKRKASARCRKPKAGTAGGPIAAAPGTALKLVGRLTRGGDVPVAGAEVTVEGQLRSGGVFARIGTTRADAQGRLSFTLPPGPSRTVRFSYDGSNTLRPSSVNVLTRVRATVRLKVSRRRLLNGQSVQFRGQLPGKPLPAGGKLVALQARVGRQWRTFATPRAKANGTFKHRYRFTATTGLRRYVFRALVSREAAYSYETGASRKVYVTVRGR